MRANDMDVFDDAVLRAGFAQLISDIEKLRTNIARHRGQPTDIIDDFNELTKRCAAMWVFVTAGRGSKVNEIRNGAVLCSEELMFVEDKWVEDERGDRLIPTTFASDWVLDVYTSALMLISQKIVKARRTHSKDVWTELTEGQLRFDAVCFQSLEQENGKLVHAPVGAADVQFIAQQYFRSNRNFMRHVVITRWTIARFDPALLRILTGHAWAGAQVPAPCSTYSPLSAIEAVREPLELLLRNWVDIPEHQRSAKMCLLDLPLRRLHKCQHVYRSVLEEGYSGPVFSRWHLAAHKFCQRVRKQLLQPLDISVFSKIYLFLIFFDGFHESCDMSAIMSSSSSFEKGANGWMVQWRRSGDQVSRITLVQPATGVLLNLLDERDGWPKISQIEAEVNAFVEHHFPDAVGSPKGALTPLDICRSACAFWMDLVLPSAIQTAYAHQVCAPVLSLRSALRFVASRSQVTPPKVEWGTNPIVDVGGQLQKLLQLVHYLGDSTKKLGQDKSRARHYEESIRAIGALTVGSIPEVLDQALRLNIRLQELGAAGRLKFSSISTYLSTLTPALKQIANENLRDQDGEALCRIGQLLYKPIDTKHQTDQHRVDLNSAAAWLLRSLRDVGYPFPAEPILQGRKSDIPSLISQSIPMVDGDMLDAIRSVIAARGRSQLDQDRLLLALELMTAVPLRWMELATLNSSHILNDVAGIRIESSGFNHIKTTSSTRTVAIDQDLMIRLKKLVGRVKRLRSHVINPLLFGYHDPAEDDTVISNWLHEELHFAARYVLEDDFRIHNLRANVVTERLFPTWSTLYARWIAAQVSGYELDQYFKWSPDKSWRAESASSAAGHSHPRSSIFYYFFAGYPLRSLCMGGVNSRLNPSFHLLNVVGISKDAHIKTCQRDVTVATNRWNHIARKLSSSGRPSLSKTVPDKEIKIDAQIGTATKEEFALVVPSSLVCARYLCLRAAGLSAGDAADECSLTLAQRGMLESHFEVVNPSDIAMLRRREGKSVGDRSHRAETEMIRSSQFDDLYLLFRSADPSSRKHILYLLRPALTHVIPDFESIANAAAVFEGSSYGLEVIFAKQNYDLQVSTRLSRIKNLSIGMSAQNLQTHPRAFVIRLDTKVSTVLKSRLRSVCSLLLYFLCNEK